MKAELQVLGVTRPNFLFLPPICVALGISAGLADGGTMNWSNLIPVIAGAVAAHAAVNALNEYTDFRSGLDLNTTRTPFSGGSGTLVQHPHLINHALWVGVTTTLITVICGLWLLTSVGPALLPFGILGLLLVLLYSGPITRNRWLSLLAPGLGFGPAMVGGSAIALTGAANNTTAVASLLVFFLINNLLLLNQFPDRGPDAAVGRRNWTISSPAVAGVLYNLFAIAGYTLVIAAALLGAIPYAGLLAILTLPLALMAARSALAVKMGREVPMSALGHNVVVSLLTPALMALGIGLGISNWL